MNKDRRARDIWVYYYFKKYDTEESDAKNEREKDRGKGMEVSEIIVVMERGAAGKGGARRVLMHRQSCS